MTGRQLALKRLLRIGREGAYIGLVSGAVDDASDAREERLATELTAGVTRWRRQLDFIIDHFYGGDPDGLEDVVRTVLRLGVYDLIHLKTPPHAAIHETVELAKRHGAKRAAGLVNGILRSIDRSRDDLPRPASGDDIEDLAIRASHPSWMIRRWVERYGYDAAERICDWNNRTPRFGIRINTLRISPSDFRSRLDEAGIAWSPARFIDDMVVVDSVQMLIRGGFITDGLCVVQDESAALVVRLLDPQPSDRVLDACAAPGGKAAYAAALMQGNGEIMAIDINPRRTKLIERAAERLNVDIIKTMTADATRLPATFSETFDRVLVDAPCSGLGVLAKRADLRWRITESDLLELESVQHDLIRSAAGAVKSGGTLVYSTCTIEPEENARQVEAFIEEHPDFEPIDASTLLPADVVDDEGYLVTLPHIHEMDGAFGAAFRRRGGP